jgi:CheY-like chemotaxis protein
MGRMDTFKSVLVVEDDLDVRDALVQILEYEGYTVTAAANGREAMDHLRSNGRPRVILLDLMMPVMDGWQFRVEQARDPGLAEIPVIVISAGADIERKASSMGAAGYFRKPIEVDALLDAVGRYCG